MKNTQRKIILNLAISLDGYICDKDGGIDWIVGDGDKSGDTEKQFDFAAFIDSVDTVVMGKNGYLDAPKGSLEQYHSHKVFVASNENIENLADNTELIKGELVSHIKSLQEQEGKDIWIYGGAGLADSFIKADVIDEYIVGIIPTILGGGRKLFLDNNPTIKLHLGETTVQEGIVIMRYTKRD